jgi:hypothetical protein
MHFQIEQWKIVGLKHKYITLHLSISPRALLIYTHTHTHTHTYTHTHTHTGDYVAATALKLVVLGTDAENNNAIVNEVRVWAV